MIELRQVCVRAGAFSLQNLSLRVEQGRHAILMGRTGSGKTTLLEAICGLRTVMAGSILIQGRDVTHMPPAARGIGLVPQDAALFDHMTVREHLAFALRVRGVEPGVQAGRVEELAEWLTLNHLLDRRPKGLSGGERQRVALGRALSFRPEVLCLDEPLSALDDDTREELFEVLRRVREHTNATILHITHNLSEARALGDQLIRLSHGRVETESES